MSIFGVDIDEAAVCIFPPGIAKHEAINQLVDAIASCGGIADVELFRKAVFEREAVMSTGIGSGVAIPHVRIDGVSKGTMGIGISHEGINFNTLDQKPVHIIVLFAMPTGSQREYLTLLAQVMTAMKSEEFRKRLGLCSCSNDVMGVLNTPKS